MSAAILDGLRLCAAPCLGKISLPLISMLGLENHLSRKLGLKLEIFL